MTILKKAPLMAFVFGLGLMLTGLTMSSFTRSAQNNKNGIAPQIVRYYKTNPATPASDPTSYQYFNGNRCEDSGSLCSALWDITDSNPAPTVDGTPLPAGATFEGSVLPGHFE